MESRTRILISVIASIAVSLVIALIAFSILKGMNTELKQEPLYDDIIEKTQALNILTASFSQGAGQGDVGQVKDLLRSLDNLLKGITSQVPGEEVLVRHLQRNYQELGPLIDQMLLSGQEADVGLERERRNILSSQVWMKVRFITDDTNRLRDMSQARVIAAQEKAGVVVIALIVILALTNGGIYYFSGRSIMRAQKAMRESEERLRFALDTCHIGAWEIDLVDHTAYRSPEHDRIFGYAELLPEWTLDMYLQHALPEYRAEVEAMVREATAAKTGWNYECRIRRSDGEIRWIWFSGQHHTESSGRSRVAGVVQDITERKLAEEALRAKEADLSEAQRLAHIGSWHWDAETDVTTGSDELLRIYGFDPATQIMPDFRDQRGRCYPVDDWERVYSAVQLTMKTGVGYELDVRAIRDGAMIWVTTRSEVLKDAGNRIVGLRGTVQDITDRKLVEEALRESEERFRVAQELSPDGFSILRPVCDSDGRVMDFTWVYANAAAERIVAMKLSALAGRSLLELFPGHRGSPFLEAYRQVSETGQTRVLESLYQGDDVLAQRWFRVVVVSMGQDIAVLSQDITERKRDEEERMTSVEFLRMVNESRDLAGLIRAATMFFHDKSGCEAVGIRIREGDDYPYFESRGFPDEFIVLENSLCDYDENGGVVCDCSGNPVINCMCGNIICGRFDPSKPFFTNNGSFWSNCTTDLLATTTDAERNARTRNRCNGEGYESVALIPLHSGNESLGLLQLNDRQKGRFTAATIALWERLAAYLAVALSKFMAENALHMAHDELEKLVEERTRDLREKEVLLKEIHHRVKNNMQVISSLVSLQADGTKDEKVREVLKDVTYRVRSMALVHEKLYQSHDLARIDFAEYVRGLLNFLWRAHGSVASSIRLTLDLEPVSLPVDTAVPCGLILNELAGNAIKHAFQGRSEGEVTVSLQSGADGRIRFCVADNGVGLPDGLDWRQAKSLGLRLVQMLAGQINAEVEVSDGDGARFEIVFSTS